MKYHLCAIKELVLEVMKEFIEIFHLIKNEIKENYKKHLTNCKSKRNIK